VRLVSARFEGLGRLAQHRLVYQALGELMGREVHALALDTRAPSELG
jgi:BolA protein